MQEAAAIAVPTPGSAGPAPLSFARRHPDVAACNLLAATVVTRHVTRAPFPSGVARIRGGSGGGP